MKIIIVGGGFAGLYAAFLLVNHSTNCHVKILEQRNKLGGKIRTKYDSHKNPYELGPSLFHSLQPNMMHIVHKLHLPIIKLNSEPKELLNLPSIEKIPLGTSVDKVIDITQMRSGNEISEMEYKNWKQSFDCEQRAHIYNFKNGWQHSIDELEKYLLASKRVKIIKQYTVKQIIHFNEKILVDKLHADYVIITTSLHQIPKIDSHDMSFYSDYKQALHVAKMMPTLRVYIEFKNPLPISFPKDIFESKSHFRWCIKMNDYLLLLCYVDGKEASKRFQLDHQLFIIDCLQELKLSHLQIQNYDFASWTNAFTILRASKKITSTITKNMHQITNNIFQTFLPDPLNESWTEGHLNQARRCVATIFSQQTGSNFKHFCS
jgi:hypothetical protein